LNFRNRPKADIRALCKTVVRPRLLHGRAPVTPEMAVKLSAAFATEAEFWVNLQAQHDL